MRPSSTGRLAATLREGNSWVHPWWTSLALVEGASMAKLTKADAARQLGIARSTLYKLIDQGKVSATPDGMIDQAELVRAAPYVDTLRERTRTPADTSEAPAQRHDETPRGRPQT